MQRYLFMLLILAFTLTACGTPSPEEQMYAAVLDVHFSHPARYAYLKRQVVYIQPTFANAPQKSVPSEIIALIIKHTTDIGLTQVNTPDPAGYRIALATIDYSRSDPTIRIEGSFSGLRESTNYKLVHDAGSWNVVSLGGGADG